MPKHNIRLHSHKHRWPLPRGFMPSKNFANNDFRFFFRSLIKTSKNVGSICCLCGILPEKDQLDNKLLFIITIYDRGVSQLLINLMFQTAKVYYKRANYSYMFKINVIKETQNSHQFSIIFC